MDIEETWNKLKEVGNNNISIYKEVDIHYENSDYIIMSKNYHKDVGDRVCVFNKEHNINFSDLPLTLNDTLRGSGLFKRYVVYIEVNLEEDRQYLMIEERRGSESELLSVCFNRFENKYCLSHPVERTELPEYINKKRAKFLI